MRLVLLIGCAPADLRAAWSPPRRRRGGRLAAVPALMAAAFLASAGCHTVGRNTTTGAIESVRTMKLTTPEEEQIAFLAAQRAVQGMTRQLATAETQAAIGAAGDEATRRALAQIHGELANGEGRLARELRVTAGQMSAAAVQSAGQELHGLVGQELDGLLGDCQGLDRRACLRREVRALGKEASDGMIDGIVASRAWILGFVVFLAGAAAALLARAAWEHLRHGSRPAGHTARA